MLNFKLWSALVNLKRPTFKTSKRYVQQWKIFKNIFNIIYKRIYMSKLYTFFAVPPLGAHSFKKKYVH